MFHHRNSLPDTAFYSALNKSYYFKYFNDNRFARQHIQNIPWSVCFWIPSGNYRFDTYFKPTVTLTDCLISLEFWSYVVLTIKKNGEKRFTDSAKLHFCLKNERTPLRPLDTTELWCCEEKIDSQNFNKSVKIKIRTLYTILLASLFQMVNLSGKNKDYFLI